MTGDLAEQMPRSFAFGPFVLIPQCQLLLQNEAPIRVGGRALDILTALVERPGELVSKRELISRVWPDTIVEESNLKVNMAALRRALGDGPGTAKYIATVTGRGYRFTAPVQVCGFAGFTPPSSAAVTPGHALPMATTRIFGKADVTLAATEHAVRSSSGDGIWLIDLALLKDPALVPNAVATAIGLAVNSEDMLAALREFLRDRKMLLVLV